MTKYIGSFSNRCFLCATICGSAPNLLAPYKKKKCSLNLLYSYRRNTAQLIFQSLISSCGRRTLNLNRTLWHRRIRNQ